MSKEYKSIMVEPKTHSRFKIEAAKAGKNFDVFLNELISRYPKKKRVLPTSLK